MTAQQGKKMTMTQLKQTILTTLTEQVKRKELSQNEETIKSLREQLSNISKPYVPEDPKYNQIYMQYLEARYPEMYLSAIKSQPVPLELIKTTLAAYQNVAAAYRVGEASPFQQATLKRSSIPLIRSASSTPAPISQVKPRLHWN